MILRRAGISPSGPVCIALLVAGVLSASSCSTSDEVVFEGAPPPSSTTPAASNTTASPASTREAGAATTVTAPITTRAATATTESAETGPPTAPTLALSERRIEVLPGQIVVNDLRTRSVTILGPGVGQVEPFASPGDDLQQPTWSPDGTLVAWSRAGSEGFAVVVTSSRGGQAAQYTTAFAVFYMQWRPDGRAIALLGSPEPGEVGLAILDLDSGTVTPLNSSSSYYLHWAPGGEELITHIGGTRIEQLDPSTGNTSLFEALDPVNSVFQAAAWTPDGTSILYVRPADPDSARAGDELVRRDISSGEIEVLAEGAGFFNFAVSPDGRAVALSIRTLEGVTSMEIVDFASGRSEEIDAPLTLAWQWSPDSRKILLLGVGNQAMSVGVYESGTITRYQEIIPTSTFLQNYLFFWSQYDLSHSLWAPDSSAFVFPAFDGVADAVFLQYLDEELPILLGPGSMAVFSPAVANP
ncbi:MAG: hypothetical protein OXF41_01775 [bacterium]|nr:hypothetical protein [bacterium]